TTTLEHDAYGATMVGRELLYYALFDPIEGEALSDLLLQQPQWWVHHVGWLGIELATTINTLHVKGLVHLGLSPSSVLVRFDAKPFVPHLVLCDLGIASDAAHLGEDWYPDFVAPAYCAPELLGKNATPANVGIHSDVYGL